MSRGKDGHDNLFDIYFSNDISQITKVLSCIYATVECCGTFLLFEVVWTNQYPN